MTNDSSLFRTREELEEQEGAYPVGGNRFASPSGDWVPLYEGKMVQAFDHRAANIVVNPENQHRPAQPVPATPEQHRNADWLPDPAILGAAERNVISDRPISACIQRRDRSDKCAVHDCGVDPQFWGRKYAPHCFDRRAICR